MIAIRNASRVPAMFLFSSGTSIPERIFSSIGDGGYAFICSADIADRLDDDLIGIIMSHLHNTLPQLWSSESVVPPVNGILKVLHPRVSPYQ